MLDVDARSSRKGWYLYVCNTDLLAKAETAAEKHRGVRQAIQKWFGTCSDSEIAPTFHWQGVLQVSSVLTEAAPQYSIGYLVPRILPVLRQLLHFERRDPVPGKHEACVE